MKHIILKLTGGLLLLGICFASSCQKEISKDTSLAGPSFNFNVDFKAVVDLAPLQFDQPYTNSLQETYSVKTFKYYISDIELTGSNSYKVSVNDCFLIDASNPASTSLSLKAAPNKYDHISFTIGVDSVRNFSGAQTGALDPANGMFWTWNSGYIMAKLEGSSPLSTQPDNRIEYHIGGFKDPDNVLQKVVLPFPEASSIDFIPNSTATVTITANVNAWFNNPNPLHIAQTSVCMTPGDLSKKIAENYSRMFSIIHIATK